MRRTLLLSALLALLCTVIPPVAAQPADPPADVVVAGFEPVAVARPGEAVQVAGVLGEGQAGDDAPSFLSTGVRLALHGPDGQVVDLGTATSGEDGAFAVDIPADVTAQIAPGERTGWRETWAVRATTADGRAVAGAAPVTFAQEAGVQLDYDFTSSVGWVKPGEAYPARVILSNFDAAASGPHTVTIAPVDGTTVTEVRSATGTASLAADGSVTWTVDELAAAADAGPTRAVLVVESVADTTGQDPQIVWKDLSATAVLDGGQPATAHGPKVIPPDERYDTARYGDRPFPVVPVDFTDFSHLEEHDAARLDEIVNSPEFEGSTFNLFQEMSYGQLFPDGLVPSAGIETADFAYEGTDGEGIDFHTAQVPPPNTCTGVHTPEAAGTPLYPERITDGWYQLPGTTGYYGQDSGGSAVLPALGVPVPASIDDGCGDTGKAVYDAAAIADPEIDYNDFDTDKDGVVDFFMMIFVGCGGNGASQLAAGADCTHGPVPGAPYDNLWPHSSTLEAGFRDAETGLSGYISDDRLTDLEGNLLFYTDETYTTLTTEDTGLPAYVRVGPYNVNPETVFDAASVISHEYGHSLGLPDFYSNGGLDLYGTWNLMASDYSQHMDAYGRQELGWVVPTEIPEGTSELEMVGSKTDINRIEWVTPDGEPYVLEGPDVHNGQMYRAGLPSRILIDPALVENGASPSHVWWSTSGNDYACPSSPNSRALDIRLPQLADVEPGTPVELSFASLFHIEWDFDYGFVMVTTDDGESYTALESQAGFTTPATQNPNNVACQAEFGNGITGTTQSHEDGSVEVDRLLGSYPENDGFATDTYDLSEYAGQEGVVLRFAYVTDVGLAEPGWFIDDVAVTADGEELYASDFEDGPDDPLIFNGGCDPDSGLGTAPICSDGFTYVSATDGAPQDHAYYLELRDRSGFDLDGYGQSDRGEITWTPGLSLGYTDEAYSYGNVSNSEHPGQHVLDAVPEPGSTSPDLDDAAFNAGEAYSDGGDGHVDNYVDPESEDGSWHFAYDCLDLEVLEMAGDEGEERADDLTATVEVTRGSGCAERDYGYEQFDLDVQRLAGPGRVQTAVEVSKAAHPDGATTALIARAGDFPDALAAAPLATAVDGPVLLTDSASLAPEVDAELERLGVEQVYLLGGTSALSPAVEDALGGYEVTRLAGEGRVQTAAAVARELARLTGGVDSAVVVRSDQFADALASSNLAVPGRDPIVLTGTDGLDADAAAVLDELVPDGATVFLAGGTAALSEQVAADVADAGFDGRRLAGASRFATAQAITRAALNRSGSSFSTAVLASGADFPDALTAGPAAAQLGGLLVLVDPTTLDGSPESRTLLATNAGSLRRLYVAGGTAAVSEGLVGEVLTALGAD
ncbi:cell wall-binding repeat-containing protein [Euzebya sp.]|uniref:cell wall-binding repeat-containing protein n=1 Tax=Euzebya sp. TaxID=1971409 RepID=UPI003519AF4B